MQTFGNFEVDTVDAQYRGHSLTLKANIIALEAEL